ncbi:MAG: hypothetical protein ACFFBP_11530 [Promethearchaeota archaeon]
MDGIGILDIQQINLMLTILQVILFTIASTYLLYKSYKIKDKNIALVAIYISFFAIFSYISAINYFFYMLSGIDILPELDFLILFIFSAVGITAWLLLFTNLLYKEKQKIIVGIYIAYIAIYLCFTLIVIILGQRHLFGTGYTPDFELDFAPIYYIPVIIFTFIFIITGVIFIVNSLKTENPVVKLKGITFLFYLIVSNIASVFEFSFKIAIFLFISRALYVVAMFGLYITFALPERIKNYILKKKGWNV